MGYDRIQYPEENGKGFVQYAGEFGRTVGFCRLQRIEHFHAGRYDGVVLDAGIILIGLLQYLMDVTAQVLERFWQTVRQRAVGACKYFTVFVCESPDAAKEAAGAFHA